MFSRWWLSRIYIPVAAEIVTERLMKEMSPAKHIAATIDTWTCKTDSKYMSLTVV